MPHKWHPSATRTLLAATLGFCLTAPAAPAAAPDWARLAPLPAAKPRDIPPGPFAPNWDSLTDRYRVPDWFVDGKFGIFIHWGLYAVPAYHNEWYAKHMYGTLARWHAAHYGPPDKFGYKDFIPMFKAEKYNPAEWAALFHRAGARYVVPVAEHHDGFAMYDSALTRWCAGKMGPKRDLIGELATAVRHEGLVFGLSSHRMEHHTFMYPSAGVKSDLFDPAFKDFYGPPVPGQMNDGDASPEFQEDWLARCQELVDKYRPQMVYFDNGVNDRAYDDVKLRFAAYYYNQAAAWGADVTLATKGAAFLAGTIPDFEKAAREPGDTMAGVWQVDDQIGNSWGYVSDMRYRSSEAILKELITAVSRNGNLLLNVSPKADGTIPVEQRAILTEIGRWLGVNGEAIYATHPWIKSLDGKFAFTVREETLYAIGVGSPGTEASIESLSTKAKIEGKVASVTILGDTSPVTFTQEESGLKLKLPPNPARPDPIVLKITGLKMNHPYERKPAHANT